MTAVEKINSDPQKYITLLGKKYPVILCNTGPNEIEREETFTSVQEQVSAISIIENGASTLHTAALSSPKSLKILAAAVVDQNRDFNQNASAEELTQAERSDSSASGQSLDLDTNQENELPCIEEAVTLALSFTEPVDSNFAYEVDELAGHNQIIETKDEAKTDMSHNSSGNAEDPADHSQCILTNEQSVSTVNDHINLGDLPITSSSTNQLVNDTADHVDSVTLISEEECSSSNLDQITHNTPPDNNIFSGFIDTIETNNSGVSDIVSVSVKLNILDYAQSEWKGDTYFASCLRNGYQMLIQSTNCNFMRQIRGDNYCALRATAFQILTQQTKILIDSNEWKNDLHSIIDRLLNIHKCDWLKDWTFADRLPYTESNKITVMKDCLTFFCEQIKLSDAIENDDDRQAHFMSLFNSHSYAEVRIFEALKLLMLSTAVELHCCHSKQEDVPIFAWLLFARDTSETPQALMLNHLNPAGKTGGIEQVEMCLLGQALQVTLRVFRPSNVEQEDFVTYYPDHMADVWDQVDLIAEDDRHYNIVVR